MTKLRLANPCQNKESKQKKHDKRDILDNINECLSEHVPLFWKASGRPRYALKFPFCARSFLTSPFEMVSACSCMANTSCNWCQKERGYYWIIATRECKPLSDKSILKNWQLNLWVSFICGTHCTVDSQLLHVVISALQNNKIKIKKLWDQENYFVILGFCYAVEPRYNIGRI